MAADALQDLGEPGPEETREVKEVVEGPRTLQSVELELSQGPGPEPAASLQRLPITALGIAGHQSEAQHWVFDHSVIPILSAESILAHVAG